MKWSRRRNGKKVSNVIDCPGPWLQYFANAPDVLMSGAFFVLKDQDDIYYNCSDTEADRKGDL